MKAKRSKKAIVAITVAVVALVLLGYLALRFAAKSGRSSGEIFLYGENHSVEEILEKEFELWSSYYQNDGMRELFVELPYYTAEYMNVWMKSDDAYRENTMAENFIREFDSLNGVNVMGIYGAAHTNIEAMAHNTNSVPCMANQLYQKYGDALHTEDLTSMALRTDTIQIGEKEYTALYFGEEDLSTVFPDYQCREFWRLENAYDDFKDNAKTGNVLPSQSILMTPQGTRRGFSCK